MTPHLSNSGFTLVEMLLTIGIVSVLAGLAISGGVASYGRGLARTDRLNAIGALREARDMALHGICTQIPCTVPASHGVHITQQTLVLFEGSSYASRYAPADVSMPLSGTRSITGANEIVFDAGTGNVRQASSFSMTGNDGRIEDMRINTYGAIDSNLERATSTPL